MSAPQTSDIFQPGDLLNNTYRIETILGRGGTSEVYKARSEISGRVIAIKALRAEFASNEDFLVLMTREEDVREIQHDAVVRYFDTQRMPDGVVYLVMDHVDGPGLDEKLAQGGMRASDLMIVGRRVCEGLIAAHGRNIVHRDLSPDNIILRNDNPAEAVIIDFGIAKDTNPGAETIVGNEFAGKYAYAAPEQLSRQADPRTDIYSLGALLLSTFRGAKPDIGRNPMEVVQKKADPLDLEGVPDPLRSLLAKMCAPNANDRFQSAKELLAAFDNPDAVSQVNAPPPVIDSFDDEEATVVVPRTRQEPTAETESKTNSAQPIGIPASAAAKSTPAPKKSNRMLGPVLAAVVLVAAGVGGFFAGLFDDLIGPSYPMADPYALVIEKGAGGTAQAVGHVPSPEIEASLQTEMARMGGITDVTLATGNISEDWGLGMLDVVSHAAALDEFRVIFNGNTVRITGLATSRNERDAIFQALTTPKPGGLSVSADLAIGPRFLQPSALEPTLARYADCGPLRLMGPPPVGYGLEDRVIVAGRFANEASRIELEGRLAELAGDRSVRVEAEVLNESLCQIDAVLPNAAPGGFDVRLGFGDRPDPNLSGTYSVGDNPVIDIRLPDNADTGFLWVSVIDVKGVVYHILPNRTRPDNTLATLQDEAADDGYLRVAFGLAEAEGRLAFEVDGETLGKSKVVALYSNEPVFDELRPTTESAASYADALQAARLTGGAVIDSLDSAIITTIE